jgi:hypothetical protein
MSGRRPVVGTAMLIALCCFSIQTLDAQEQTPDSRVQDARPALEKWVEIKQVVSKEKQEWALGRELLTNQIAVVKREIDTLRARIDETGKSIAEATEKKADLVSEHGKLEEAAKVLEGAILPLETRVKELLSRLPDPIRERVKPLSQRIPENPGDTVATVAERYQSVIGILNEVNKFNGEITVRSEMRALPDGTTAEVTAVYLGIGQGFYVTGGGKIAGVGLPTKEGWSWTPANEAALEIAKAVAILKDERVAEFVRLPVRIE